MDKKYNGFVFKPKGSVLSPKDLGSLSGGSEKEKSFFRARSESVGFAFKVRSEGLYPPGATPNTRPGKPRKEKEPPKKKSEKHQERFVFRFSVGSTSKPQSVPACKQAVSTGKSTRSKKKPQKDETAQEHTKDGKTTNKKEKSKTVFRRSNKKSSIQNIQTTQDIEESKVSVNTHPCETHKETENGTAWTSLEDRSENEEQEKIDKVEEHEKTTPLRLSVKDHTILPTEMHPSVLRSVEIKRASGLEDCGTKEVLPVVLNELLNELPNDLEAIPMERISPIKNARQSLSATSDSPMNAFPFKKAGNTPVSTRKRMTIGANDFTVPSKIRRLSLDVFDHKRCSVFQTRRESLFGYDQIYGGSVSPEDFYRHSNSSQCQKTRIKQILLWIAKYIANGHVKIEGISLEKVQSICQMYMKRISSLVLPEREKKKEDSHIVENATGVIEALNLCTGQYSNEIQKWKELYGSMLHAYTLNVPLQIPEENTRRLSMHRQSLSGLVSFDATVIGSSPLEIKHILVRNLEDLHSSLNSSRYFMFLSLEYAKRVCGSLLEASHPLDKSRANALLHVLCRISQKSRL